MDSTEICRRIAAKYQTKPAANVKAALNRAIRTLAGGNELLDSLKTTHAAKKFAELKGTKDLNQAIGAAITDLKRIRTAMADHILASVDAYPIRDSKSTSAQGAGNVS